MPNDRRPDGTVLSRPSSRGRADQHTHTIALPFETLVPQLTRLAATEPTARAHLAERANLATGFLPLVRSIARRYVNRGEPLADLEQSGSIGLLQVLDRFDPAPDSNILTAFVGYATPCITGEIRRHFRDRTWAVRVPRRVQELRRPLQDAITELSRSLGRSPRPSEIAEHMSCSVDVVVEALSAREAYRSTSLDSVADGAYDSRLGWIDGAFDRVEHRTSLRRAFAELPELQRAILTMRFFDDLTQTQIAARVGFSQVHVSRLLSRALSSIRARLAAD